MRRTPGDVASPRNSSAANTELEPSPDALRWTGSATAADSEARFADERFADDEPAPDPEYRRRRKPVPVRRSHAADWLRWWQRGWKPLLYTAIGLGLAAGLNAFFFHSRWFVLEGSSQIDVQGARHTDAASVLDVFGGDLGRNVFFIPLSARLESIDALPWVRSASVLRLWPARLRIMVQERTPIAYGRSGNRLVLLDADGVVLPPPASGHFNFPVLSGLPGLSATRPNVPGLLERRHAAMQLYASFRTALGSQAGNQLGNFSEIDLSDPSDLQARVTLPGAPESTVLIHFGDHNFAARYQLFRSQIAGWRQQYPALASVDLHFDGEAIVDPGTPPAAAPSRSPSPHPGRKP